MSVATLVPTTWNPADKDSSITLSNGNKTAASAVGGVRSVAGVSEGKYYAEFTISAGGGGGAQQIGIATPAAYLADWPSQSAYAWIYDKSSGHILNASTPIDTVAANATTISLLLDADNKKLQFWRNGTPVGPEITLTGTVWHVIFGRANTCVGKFGGSAFTYSVPTGYNSGFGTVLFDISGNVKDAAGANAARVVRAYRRDTGSLAGSATSDAGTGNYALTTAHGGEHTLVFLDDDAGTAYNALALDRVTGA